MVLEIPAGALDGPVTFTLGATDDADPLGSELSTFSGPMIAVGPKGTTFKKPVKLTVPVDLKRTQDFEQDASTCKVWLKNESTWNQLQPVAHGDESVTVEIDRLDTAAAGVVFNVVLLTAFTPVPPCTDPTGFCVEDTGKVLEGGGKMNTASEVKDGKFFYVRTQTGPKFSVVEHDLVAGTTRETQQLVGNTDDSPTPFAQKISLAPDGVVWAAFRTYGSVQFPFTGLPTRTSPLSNQDIVAIDHISDGRRYTFSVSRGTNPSRRVLFFSTIRNGANPTSKQVASLETLSGGLTLAQHVPDKGFFLVFSDRLMRYVDTPSSDEPAQLGLSTTDVADEIAVDATGALRAVSINSANANGRRVIVTGSLARTFSQLPNIVSMDFSTDGFLYAIGGTSADVYRLDPTTGGVQTIALSKAATDSTEYRSFIPKAIRRLPNKQMLLLTGEFSRKVVRLRPAQ